MFKKVTKLLLIVGLVITGFASKVSVNISAYESDKDTHADNSLLENPEYLDLIKSLIGGELDYGLSGAQLAVYKDGKLVIDEAFGYTNTFYNTYNEDGSVDFQGAKALPKDERTAVTTDTLFDMASNTKMYAAVYAMQKLVDEGKVEFTTLIKDLFTEFTDVGNENGWKDIITVEHVLSHYAGFAPDPQYHNNYYDEDDGIKNGVNDLFSQDKATTLKMVMKTPVTTKPGTKWAYSDVDMMLIGFIVEKLTGQDLDTYVKETFYKPLGLDRITFNPLDHGFSKEELTSSEVHGNTRDGRINFINARETVVTGEVHDEKAYYSMDGVSGHAGLFGTAKQVAYLAQVMFDGTLDSKTFFSQDTIDEFTESADLTTQARGGWRRRNSGTGAGAWFSYFSPEGTIGHTGWSGTVTFIDPVNNVTVALFTTRTNTPIHGPGANDFWTANSNVTSYTAVTEFVYQALGLGNDQSIDSTLTNMLAVEIGYQNGAYLYPTQAIIDGYTPAKRNVIRALMTTLEDVENNLRVLDTSRDPLFRQRVEEAKGFLKTTENKDTYFLRVTKLLDESLKTFRSLDSTLYTIESYEAVVTLASEAVILLEEFGSQTDIDSIQVRIQTAIDNLVLLGNKETLASKLDEVLEMNYDKELYTEASFNNLVSAIEHAQVVLDDANATQQMIDEALAALTDAVANLVKIDEPVDPEPVPKPKPKPEESLPNTGVSSAIPMMGILTLLLGGILLIASKKRKLIKD